MLAQFLIAFAAALAAVVLFRLLAVGTKRRRPEQARLERDVEPIVFLFRDRVLVDATSPARLLLSVMPGDSDWQRVMGWLASRLPQETGLDREARPPRLELTGDNGFRLLAEDLGSGHLRLTLADPTAANAGIVVDSLSFAAMEHELQILRSTIDHSPMLAWRQDGQGHVTWANSAYLQMVEEVSDGETQWPLPRLIDLPAATVPAQGTVQVARRMQVRNDQHGRWYDCHIHDVADQTVAMALPADAAVRAERSLREFVQTLTKTFADLPIGLAIFDRDRKLQLFNPALIDLTGLATGFLTARPTLFAFLDRLREARMVPEPKDYRSWREQMNSLEAAASSGRHVETWSLPGGQTYRVTGRPHPDGAIAFLLEDITSEISLTRKFRADLSLGADVLDALDDAIAVFAVNGELILSNRRYTTIWNTPPRGTLEDQFAHWTAACGDSPGLAALRQAFAQPASDPARNGAIAGSTGGLLSWSLRSLSGGRTLLRFQAMVDLASVDHPVRQQTGQGSADLPGDSPEQSVAQQA